MKLSLVDSGGSEVEYETSLDQRRLTCLELLRKNPTIRKELAREAGMAGDCTNDEILDSLLQEEA